jgi:hypothetical protein
LRLAVATVLVALTLGACTELPDRVGALGDCAQIDAAAYEARDGASWRTVDLTGGGYRSQAAGQNMERCWPRVHDMNTTNRRCVQTNDLVVEMRTDDAVSYYRIPARTTYMLYGEAGQARCQVVVQED